MRVLHLASSDIAGGASRGSYWLHQALVEQGVDSRMLVKHRASDDPRVSGPGRVGLQAMRVANLANRAAVRAARGRASFPGMFSVNWMPTDLVRMVRAQRPDIVHVHWAGAGMLPTGALASLGPRVVWTLRDMWPFTGGCHYTGGCEAYLERCGACPQLGSSRPLDLSRLAFAYKRRHVRRSNVVGVAISNWVRDCALAGPVWRDRRIEVVYNGIFTDVFRPMDGAEARRSLGLPAEGQLVLFGALAASADPRKGFPELMEAMRMLAKRRPPGAPPLSVAVFGADAPDNPPELGLPIHWLGYVSEDERLRAAYAACDVMVTPSIQEAFGKTLAESLACGTPVVAFDTGGPADIVLHEQTGFLARVADPASLAEGIGWVLDHTNDAMRRACRQDAVARFDIRVIADQYRAVYDTL